MNRPIITLTQGEHELIVVKNDRGAFGIWTERRNPTDSTVDMGPVTWLDTTQAEALALAIQRSTR